MSRVKLVSGFKCNAIVLPDLDFFLLNKTLSFLSFSAFVQNAAVFFLSFGLSFLSYWSALPLQSSAFARRSSFGPKDFLLRARVLNLYRQALRTAQRAPVHARAELRQTIRQEMEKNRNCNDKQRIRFLISEGLERLKGLDEMLDMQGH